MGNDGVPRPPVGANTASDVICASKRRGQLELVQPMHLRCTTQPFSRSFPSSEPGFVLFRGRHYMLWIADPGSSMAQESVLLPPPYADLSHCIVSSSRVVWSSALEGWREARSMTANTGSWAQPWLGEQGGSRHQGDG